ncbi:zinc ribbon domain-containing protein [Streptomyces lydicus]|uniref:zinc ribbon domain-containing protein n=1 Tax=Streptomyces lydicus TaxID=47763 RepID=UPI0037AA7E00
MSLDSPPEPLRQLAYKTSWYGSELVALARWWSASKSWSECGGQSPRLTLSDKTFRCSNCGLRGGESADAGRRQGVEGRGDITETLGTVTEPVGDRCGFGHTPHTPASRRAGLPC